MAKRKSSLDPMLAPQGKPRRPKSTSPSSRAGKSEATASKSVAAPNPTPAEQAPVLPVAPSPAPARSWRWLRLAGGVVVVLALIVASFELVYANKVFPGVTAAGASIGGLSKEAATRRVSERINDFSGHVVTITQGDTNLRIPVTGLEVTYDASRASELAFNYGRQGSWPTRIHQQLRALLGRSTDFEVYSYDDARLVPYVNELAEDVVTPALNASLSFNSGEPQVTPAQAGVRLDVGRLIQLVGDRLGHTSSEPIIAPTYEIPALVSTASLQAVTSQLGGYVSGPITLRGSANEIVIDQPTIISWIEVGSKPRKDFFVTKDLADLYKAPVVAQVGLNQASVKKYVAELAAKLDRSPQNAGLAMSGGALTIASPSRTGIKLDQDDTIKQISAALAKSDADRAFDLKLATTQADVNENNLDSLGIKEQISEGETYFPGSPSTRLTNVRAGARQFNGVLLKPGETFSFGKLLGDVGPETGYVPELVIIGNHEEKQYGGGLCQVSSTAFRAALAAGLPITERVNHSFAISYYTWPYAAPGVDATIYYPAVDFKFVNDTGHYILMQTEMKGYDLKFYFFGTKTKSGLVRGPSFLSGSNDATKSSHTVFYRDVLDLAGNVVKTDTFHTYYKPSTDFPIVKEFN